FLQFEQHSLSLQFELVPESLKIAKVGSEDRVLAVAQPVRASFADSLAAGAVLGVAAGEFTESVEHPQPGRRDQAARVDGQQSRRLGDAEFGQVVRLASQ